MEKVFNELSEMKKYYNKQTNIYELKNFEIVSFAFPLKVKSSLDANIIKCKDIDVLDITVDGISAKYIKCRDITANDINTDYINARYINYASVCFVYKDLICKDIMSISGIGKYLVLEGRTNILGDRWKENEIYR